MFSVLGEAGPFVEFWVQLWMKCSCKFCHFSTWWQWENNCKSLGLRQSLGLTYRQLLLTVFSRIKLHSKHQFTEHYPYLIQMFGPWTECWTIRFEAKQSFFKKVLMPTTLKTFCSLWPQDISWCWHIILKCQAFSSQRLTSKVSDVCLEVLDTGVRQAILRRFSDVDRVGLTPSVFLNGTTYSKGMILSAGSTSGLPDFLLAAHVCFIIEPFIASFLEHLQSSHLVKKNPPEQRLSMTTCLCWHPILRAASLSLPGHSC